MSASVPQNSDIEIIAPNLNRRLSGVTSTIVRLVPIQAKSAGIVSFGVALPDFIPRISIGRLLMIGYTKTRSKKPRIWHARRNIEMLLGLALKYLLRQPYKLIFTSASQRSHTSYTRFLIGRMDHVIATSAATAKYLKVPYTIILHGIPVEDFSPATDLAAERLAKNIPGNFVIGCFGRIRNQKGTDVFVDAMIELLPRHPHATAIILGRATQSHQAFLQKLQDRITDKNLSDRILFKGEAPVDEIAQWYKTLSLFVAPQRWEGFGLTPLEAMGCALPVVAANVGAFPEIIKDGHTGALIEPGDVEQMVAAVEHYVNNRKICLDHGQNSLERVHHKFRLEREASQILDVYNLVQDNTSGKSGPLGQPQ